MIEEKSAVHKRCFCQMKTVIAFCLLLPPVMFLILQTAFAAPAERIYYFPWYDNTPASGISQDWILISNQGDSPTEVQIFVGDGASPVAVSTLAAAGSAGDQYAWQSPTVIMDGPVKVVSAAGQPLNVSQRVVYADSFNEIRAVSDIELESDYVFSWYDNNPEWGMNGNWICVANAGAASTSVNIFVGGITDSSTPVATLGPIAAGGHIEWQSPVALTDGPVRIVSTR